jgi:cell shape-determining protein MreC
MTIYDRPPAVWSAAPSPFVCLFLVLTAAAGLAFLPQRVVSEVRQVFQSGLTPGLRLVASSRDAVEATLGLIGNLGSGTRRAAHLECEVEQLRQTRGQLEAEIVWLRSRIADGVDADASRLVHPRLLPAHVLGQRAQSFLRSQGILDAGANADVSAGDLVLDLPPAMIDQGASAGAASGQLVLKGRRVWGKVSRADPQISTVIRATDAGYRDLVRIAQPGGDGLTIGPRGVLEGTGEPLCRLRQVPLTQSVAVGQLVISDGGEGLLDGALLYGEIERVEQSPGAAHWDIWVRPALPPDLPRTVSILIAEAPGSIRR